VMASVPNMRSGPVPAVAGTPAPILAGGAEFASLLPSVPAGLQPALPLAPVEPGIATINVEDGSDADPTVESDAPTDAAQLAALLPLLPVPAPTPPSPPPATTSDGPPRSSRVVLPAKAQAAPVATLPVRPEPAAAPGAVATQQLAPGTAKQVKPIAAEAPVGPEAGDGSAEAAPPTGIAIETAKKVVEQAFRSASPVKAGMEAPPARAPTNARMQNAPVEREEAPAVETAPPLLASASPSAMPNTTPPAATPAPAAPPQAGGIVDRSIERELDLARDGEWLDRLARDIARTAEGDAPMRFRLHPQTLGHMRVELAQGDHGTSVRLTVETEAARAILADAQPRLAAEARAQGVRIAETHVDLSGSGDQRRQEEAGQTPIIRTARQAAPSGAAPVQPARSRSDRYA
jgi:flagellar hook-length control protein FliK